MIDSICVIGHPSSLGGADTELDHQMRCWAAMGIEVHVCPTAPLDAHLLEMKLEDRGVVYHAPRDWPSVEGLHCIAYCNDVFLSEIAAIGNRARSTTFVNCMSWNFAKELEAQEQGLIDFHLYQTKHSYWRVSEKLRGLGNRSVAFGTSFRGCQGQKHATTEQHNPPRLRLRLR